MSTTKTVWVALLAALGAGCNETQAAPTAGPPPTVTVLPVVMRDVPVFTEAVAALDGYDNADIRARVRGYLREQKYADGSRVKAGDLLFTIEQTEYLATAAAARASRESAKAERDRAALKLERDKGLRTSGMISQQDLDNTIARAAESEAQVAATQAALDTALLNLSYTQIHAPIDGIAGLALVRVGNLVGQDGPTLLTTVSQTDPIRINFPLSEVDYVRYPERFRNLERRNLAWAKKQLAALDAGGTAEDADPGVELVLADGSVYAHKAVIVTANRQIDASTGTLQVQALAANPDGFLRPGQFGRARIRRKDAGHAALVVPEKALIAMQGSFSVAVVGADDKVHLRKVELGPAANGIQILTSGVAEGDRIVVDGVQKVTDGALVNPKPALQK